MAGRSNSLILLIFSSKYAVTVWRSPRKQEYVPNTLIIHLIHVPTQHCFQRGTTLAGVCRRIAMVLIERNVFWIGLQFISDLRWRIWLMRSLFISASCVPIWHTSDLDAALAVSSLAWFTWH